MSSDLRCGNFFIERGVTGRFIFSGQDHLRYLHNRLTQDIKSLIPGGGSRSLCLSPNGRVQGELFILKEENSIDIITGEVPSKEYLLGIKDSILQFKVADHLECIESIDDICRVTLIGSELSSLATMLGIEMGGKSRFSHFKKSFDESMLTVITNSVLEFDLLEVIGPKDAIEQLKQMGLMLGIKKLDDQTVSKLRILSKTWQFGVDVDEKTLAAEVALGELVSFKKGCYPGQEVVEMSIARGRPNRSLELLVVDREIAVGDDIRVDDKVVGIVTSLIFIPEEGLSYFLSRIKTDAVSSTNLVIGGQSCRVVTDQEVVAEFA